MNHIPFAALPRAEREAIVAALRRSGIGVGEVCVSKLELLSAADGSPTCLATVTGRGWGATYDARRSWTVQLVRDLQAREAAGLPV